MGSTPLEEEPIYGKTYLPQKYKVAVAIPPCNDVDVFAHCCGFIAIIQDGRLQGFNVTMGSGLGFTRVKYTAEDYGPEWYREQVEKTLGKKLGEARPF